MGSSPRSALRSARLMAAVAVVSATCLSQSARADVHGALSLGTGIAHASYGIRVEICVSTLGFFGAVGPGPSFAPGLLGPFRPQDDVAWRNRFDYPGPESPTIAAGLRWLRDRDSGPWISAQIAHATRDSNRF